LVLGESFDAAQAVGFGCIWAALAIYAANGWRRSQQPPAPVEPHCDAHVPSVDGAAPVCEQVEALDPAPATRNRQSTEPRR
jgi:chloramphenicol-sensitive protein RarD